MLRKLPPFLKVILLSLCSTTLFAADISFSGETQVCPGQNYTYTASASNAFGSRAGSWSWTFWRNGEIIQLIGLIEDCPAGPGSSTSTITFNWGNTLGPVKIQVRFKGVNDPLCQFTSPDEKWIDVNVRVLSPGPISGLVFCGSNETRTVSIPGILPFNSAQSCYYHYKYDWLVPNGWSVVPADNSGYDFIPGGIRTFATSVRITSQPTPLAPRNDGNYNIIVRTEPVWPWPMESTGLIWVGNPPADNSTLIWSGVRGVNPITVNTGSLNYYQVDNVLYTNSYSWSLPRGFTAYGSSTTTAGAQISVNTSNQAGTYLMLCRANNVCGYSWTNGLTINVVGSGGGGGQQMRAAFPNPANDSFTVKVKEEDSKEVAEVALFNKSMERVYYVKTEEKEVVISTTNLLPGVYYLNVVLGKEVTQKQVVINH